MLRRFSKCSLLVTFVRSIITPPTSRSNHLPAPESSIRRRNETAPSASTSRASGFHEDDLRFTFRRALRNLKNLEKLWHQARSGERSHAKSKSSAELQQQFHREVMCLVWAHFDGAEPIELCQMLRIAASFRTNSSQVVFHCARALAKSAPSLSASTIVKIVSLVGKMKEIGIDARTKIATFFLRHLCAVNFDELIPSEMVQLLYIVQLGPEPVVPEAVGRLVLARSFEHLRPEKPGKEPPLRAVQISTVVSCIVQFQMFNDAVRSFFVESIPICIRQCDELSGFHIANILSAYAIVAIHHTELFLTLGTRAGNLGELLRPNEAGKIIRAFEMTSINCDGLRRSLDSAMQLKHIDRLNPTTSR